MTEIMEITIDEYKELLRDSIILNIIEEYSHNKTFFENDIKMILAARKERINDTN